ncbi:DUF5777 family beta-barrel protein [Winogradskyella immobilis]|uniref:DUF5777 domain-containing protein n=1 Tax=Winogradskyella immobilis TaxID=2816852 RepID=A0ABS8EKM5_9FLAO|nr:DUF5777 family beta-barrel protein [Winogradskyella immobilis]MCC1483576.1 hypothetical protein [Winogradskyella immobilis]MCG0015670.1 DUF5777 family beta-barrel protein [Winogradskyella immobilis]
MKKIVLIALLFIPLGLIAQDDLLDELESEVKDEKQVATAVFKGVKIVNFESTKLVGKNQLNFIISHRFGTLRDGVDNFFGLDQASARIQFIYGPTDWLNISASRSGFGKTYDLSAKYRFVQQTEGGSPFTLAGFNIINVNTELDSDLLPNLEFNDRLGYASQLLISRKFNDWLSLELIPTYFHDNTVFEDGQDNSQFALGFGGRFKLSKRFALIADYGLHLNRVDNSVFNNPLAVGVEIETGGHVFQLHFSNSQAIFANGFLGQARGDFGDGDIFFGFNLSRAFSL